MNSKKIRKIREIEKRVPQEWRDNLMKMEYVAPDLRDEAITTLKEFEDEGKTDEKDYKRLKNLFEAGTFDHKHTVVDPEMAKKIEDFIDEGIEAAIKSGELPKPKDDKELKDYVKKIKRNEQRKQKHSLRAKQGGQTGSDQGD